MPIATRNDAIDLEANTRNYVQLIATTQEDVDILVFPEHTLNRIQTAAEIPNSKDLISPCGDERWTPLVQDISCATQKAHRYAVVNMVTQRNCTEEKLETHDTRPCSHEDVNYYNTVVVFDRDGTVIGT